MIEFAIIPVLLAGTGAAISAVRTLIKARTRHELGVSVRSNAADRATLQDQLGAGNVTGAEAIVRKHIEQLTPAEQREAKEALDQPSPAGRARYIRDLVSE